MCDYGCTVAGCKVCAPLQMPAETPPEGMHWCNYYGAAYFLREKGKGQCYECRKPATTSTEVRNYRTPEPA